MTKTYRANTPIPALGSMVQFRYAGRVVSGEVRSTVTGAGCNHVVLHSRDLGHTNRIDHGVTVRIADLLPVPAHTLTEQRTGVSDETHVIAEEVAKLRLANTRHGDDHEYSQILDRIAGMVPQRARAIEGESWWLHGCGYVELHYDRDGTPAAGTCTKCDERGEWRALYTLGGE